MIKTPERSMLCASYCIKAFCFMMGTGEKILLSISSKIKCLSFVKKVKHFIWGSQ